MSASSCAEAAHEVERLGRRLPGLERPQARRLDRRTVGHRIGEGQAELDDVGAGLRQRLQDRERGLRVRVAGHDVGRRARRGPRRGSVAKRASMRAVILAVLCIARSGTVTTPSALPAAAAMVDAYYRRGAPRQSKFTTDLSALDSGQLSGVVNRQMHRSQEMIDASTRAALMMRAPRAAFTSTLVAVARHNPNGSHGLSTETFVSANRSGPAASMRQGPLDPH